MIISSLATYIANYTELAGMLYHSTSVSCKPVQIFGLTTANQLAPALCMNHAWASAKQLKPYS